jgi:hypothetical protein
MVFLGSLPKNLILRRSPLEYLGVNSTTVSKDGIRRRCLLPILRDGPAGLLRMRFALW